MKITLIREDRESGKETLSTCEADAWIDRIKTETKGTRHKIALHAPLHES